MHIAAISNLVDNRMWLDEISMQTFDSGDTGHATRHCRLSCDLMLYLLGAAFFYHTGEEMVRVYVGWRLPVNIKVNRPLI